MSDPTPELTAEEEEFLGDLFDRPTTDDEVVALRLWAEVESRVTTATSKAFEQAAKMEPDNHLASRKSLDYYAGWVAAVRAYSASIRALAKEQGG